ncbi:MAG: mechanosensitive ion channel family protein [Longimicrobiales bacterium]
MEFLQGDTWTARAAGVLILLVLAWIANAVTKGFFLGLVGRVASRTRSTWDDRLVARKVFHRLANVAPALVAYYGITWALGVGPEELAAAAGEAPDTATTAGWLILAARIVRRVALAWTVLALAMAFGALLGAVDDIYRERFDEARERPIKGYLQVLAIFVYVAAGIVVVAILADRSPVVFLSGLGALTAVLLLVFRDTILSLVASVQIMSNDMIRIGDWVEMPQNNADGDVIDIALHTVKIQNWDKTISTVPTHKFISESFKNWRGMSESGGRRIKRSLHLDMNTVRFLDDGEVERLGRYEFLQEYMSGKRALLDEVNQRDLGEDVIPERRALTNVGTFRAYVFEYLKRHPRVHQGMTVLVRQLAPTPQGLPIELYCFSADTAWAAYEGLQADIFDHLIALLPEFGLRVYQQPAGTDFRTFLSETAEESGLRQPAP